MFLSELYLFIFQEDSVENLFECNSTFTAVLRMMLVFLRRDAFCNVSHLNTKYNPGIFLPQTTWYLGVGASPDKRSLNGQLLNSGLFTPDYKLSVLKRDVPLRSWLFKIAHNKCIYFLHSLQAQLMTWEEEWDNIPDTTPEASETLEQQEMATEAWSSLIALRPPRERACVILKDLLDHTLNEIAETLNSWNGMLRCSIDVI